jgi:ubiquinone/menaquinone biosynthesis C-methylase UbiE
MAAPDSGPPIDRGHYSYTTYADRGLAERFDQLRFGGPIGTYLLETQRQLLLDAVPDPRGRRIADVGTGTGRAALALAEAGADVVGLDASQEMLDVARQRAAAAHAHIQFDVADAHALPLGDRTVDVAVSLRLLMHVPDWQRCVSELCRVATWRVIVDFPARLSAAALESYARRVTSTFGAKNEPYRLLAEADVARALASHGFRVITRHRQFVLPIALHKAIGSRGFTVGVERALTGVGASRLFGSPVTMVAER